MLGHYIDPPTYLSLTVSARGSLQHTLMMELIHLFFLCAALFVSSVINDLLIFKGAPCQILRTI